MTYEEFRTYVHAIYGENPPHGWQADLSTRIAVSQPTISKLYRGLTEKSYIVDAIRNLPEGTSVAVTRTRAPSEVTFKGPAVSPKLAEEKEKEKETAPAAPKKSDGDILREIQSRFSSMKRIAKKVIYDGVPSLIIAGPAGCGKTHPIMEISRHAEMAGKNVERIAGTIRASFLYEKLYENRDGVIIFDDCDAIFADEDSLNLLKAALDSTETRQISYLKRSHHLQKRNIPETFLFTGGIIFITNMDIPGQIRKGTKLSPHLQALSSRSLLIDLGIRDTHAMILHIEDMVLDRNILNLPEGLRLEIMDFLYEHATSFRDPISLRTVVILSKYARTEPMNWREDMRAVMLQR